MTVSGVVAIHVYTPSLPAVAHDLNASDAAVQLSIMAYMISVGFAQLLIGPLSDRFGRRPLLIAGPLLMVLSAVGLLTLRSVTAVLVFRLIQGAGSALAYSGASPVVADVAPVHRRASMLAL